MTKVLVYNQVGCIHLQPPRLANAAGSNALQKTEASKQVRAWQPGRQVGGLTSRRCHPASGPVGRWWGMSVGQHRFSAR